ncbi:MAG: insulinase family protein [Candidatus Kerfeldbacteria bacterium]|nr:insulinase family protein [Candidatus Kerfeldbacteria bacterium]
MSMVSKKLTLKNGTRVLFAPVEGTKAVTVLILFPVGSRHESRQLNGSSHFLEHLFFKGTANRPSTLEISKELDGVGAEYNAFTGKDYTGYYVKVSADKLGLALEVLSDMLYNSLFDPAEIERERGVIVEEINMYEDNPMMLLDELFEQLVFNGNSLARRIAGPRSVIRKVRREQLMAYKAKYYTPHNLLLTIAGKFAEREATSLVKKNFDGVRGPRRSSRFVPFHPKQRRPAVEVKFRETEQVQIGLGFPAFGYRDRRLPALTLLSTILGGTMSSRLFINIRERLGLAYFIRSEASIYQDTGTFLVRAGLDKRRLRQALEKIWEELQIVRREGVTDEELSRSREYIKGKIILNLEDSEHIADWVGKQMLLEQKVETPEQKIKKLFSVTAGQVRQVARDVIHKRRLNLALIGPYRQPKDFVALIGKLKEL